MRCGWGNAHFVLRAIRTACLGQYGCALGQYALRAQDNTHCVLRAIRLCPREMVLRLRMTERF